MREITSPTNPLIKSIVRLRDRHRRDDTHMFIIEGFDELDRARLRPDLVIDTVLTSQGESYTPLANEEIISVTDAVFEKVAVRGPAARLLAVARQFDTSLAALPHTNDLVLIAEGIEKPGNLGTMLRTADAVGAAVVVCDPLVDVFNPSVVRASLGCLFSVPIATGSVNEIVAWASGHTTVVATPEAPRTLFELDLTGPTAVVIGSEHSGVSAAWKRSANVLCSIPMAGHADSLNAATSAAVMLYEAVRQRQLPKNR
ncbi:MAG: RNA methyltransferase [Acidimicrobiia bacterium]|nr:RNA methyltransferase [Acidimicrobiia bacterium]MDH5420675.1 RNA methyltransferase [Acidimicrobiia bacterium]MDH5502462.1 RNA methyltransferase [Acidimicrobiia bacterium]